MSAGAPADNLISLPVAGHRGLVLPGGTGGAAVALLTPTRGEPCGAVIDSGKCVPETKLTGSIAGLVGLGEARDERYVGSRGDSFAEAARRSVSAACRTFGAHRSTYYHCKRQVDRHGLEMLRPSERRWLQMPNALPKMIDERIASFSIAHPGLGPDESFQRWPERKWGGIILLPTGCGRFSAATA